MPYKCLLLSLVCLLLDGPLRAHAPSWFEKFQEERAKAFGPVRLHSTEEVKQFLLIREPLPVARPIVVSPAVVEPETLVVLPEPEKPAAKKTKKRKKGPVDRVPVEAILERARKAHASGRLDEAQRYYRLVKKADPGSVEATEKLDQLRREME